MKKDKVLKSNNGNQALLNEGAQIKFKKTNNIFHPSQGLAIHNLKKAEIYIYCCNLKLSISIPFWKFKYFKNLEKNPPPPPH